MPMRVLMIGGTAAHPGGVEAFCARAAEAFGGDGDIRLDLVPADTAFLPIRRWPLLILQAWRTIRRHRGGIGGIWLHYVNLPDLAYLVMARVMRVPVLVTPHLGTNWRSQSNPVLRRLSRALLGRANGIALLSPTQEREIALPAHVRRWQVRTFLPRHLWAQPVPERDASRPLRLIHSARLSEGKGTFLFVDLCAMLRDRGLPFSACITGGSDAATMARLHAQIAGLDLADCIEVTGLVGVDEQLARLRAADVLVHLSRIDSYPLIVLESLACGVFPICLELAGARDMVESYAGRLVPPQSPVESAADILSATDLAALRGEALAAAERVRADHRWDECVALLKPAMAATFG